MATPPEKSRRRFRITLRVLILLVFAFGSFLAWRSNRVYHQRRGVGAIRAARGSVLYDYQFSDGQSVPNGKLWGPPWLRRLTGDEYFQEVTGVLLDRPVTDATLESLAGLDRLESLVMFYPEPGEGLRLLAGMTRLEQVALRGRGITDATVQDLSRLPNLWKLDLTDSVVTDAGLVHLARFPALTWLSLSNSEVTDAGLVHLAGLTRLRTLELRDLPKVTGVGLAHLRHLNKLETLDLSHSGITDEDLAQLRHLSNLISLKLFRTTLNGSGLVHLGGMKKLRTLSLSASKLEDAGLAHLAGLANLESLDLSDTEISDAGLVHLYRLKKLRTLRLVLTNVGAEGFNNLRTALPGLAMVSTGLPGLTGTPVRVNIIDPADEMKKIEGTWAAVSWELNGETNTVDDRQPIRCCIEGNAITDSIGAKSNPLKMAKMITNFDSGATPYPIMDLTSGKGRKRQTVFGIYKVEGDTLRICTATRPDGRHPDAPAGPGDRPTEFATKPGDRRLLRVFKRVNAGD